MRYAYLIVNEYKNMNFEVPTAVVLQTEAFWDVRPC